MESSTMLLRTVNHLFRLGPWWFSMANCNSHNQRLNGWTNCTYWHRLRIVGWSFILEAWEWISHMDCDNPRSIPRSRSVNENHQPTQRYLRYLLSMIIINHGWIRSNPPSFELFVFSILRKNIGKMHEKWPILGVQTRPPRLRSHRIAGSSRIHHDDSMIWW